MEMFGLVGETVRRLRKQRGLTLAQLGAQAKLGRGQLSRIENSHQEATFSTMEKILSTLGVSRSEFFKRYDLVEGEKVARHGSPRSGLLRNGRRSLPPPERGRACPRLDPS